MKPKLLISACLCGDNCKYDGKSNYIDELSKLETLFDLIKVCPEVLGGLSIPRSPSEIYGSVVINKDGIDVTKEFDMGANKALKIAIDNNVNLALLKEKSPSCAKYFIYDGTFSNKLIGNMGITSRLLMKNNIEIYSSDEIEILIKTQAEGK
ncbi:MAG: DUF523 domain-containing protein [Anaeroplasmataceae bacterium]